MKVALAAAVLALTVGNGAETWFTFQDAEIDESSGIVVSGDTVLTINDSGDSARVFVVDPETGETIGTTAYADAVTDVEALALTPDGQLYVGDIGDNNGQREFIRIYALPAPTGGDASVEATSYDLIYEDGPRDAETLLVHPVTGRVLIVTKGLLSGSVYQAPAQLRSDRTNILRRVGSAPGLITDGAFFSDASSIVLRDYTSAYVVEGSNFGVRTKVRLPEQPQAEGLAVVDDRELVLTTEGANSDVLRFELPPRALETASPEPTPELTPAPTPVPTETPDVVESERPWGGYVVPIALGAAWIVLAVLALRWVVRRRAAKP